MDHIEPTNQPAVREAGSVASMEAILAKAR